MFQQPSIHPHDPPSLSVRQPLRRNAHLMAWSIVIGVLNWWSGCKFHSHGCHYLSSPSFIIPSVYPCLSLRCSQLPAPSVPRLVSLSLAALICPISYWLLNWMLWRSWNIHSWNPSRCPDEIHPIKLFAVLQREMFVLAANQRPALSVPDQEVEGMPGCCCWCRCAA